MAYLGSGDDTFVWDPGDGSDIVEGQAGRDTMLFNGAAAAEHVDLSANGRRLRFFRDVGNITMDTNESRDGRLQRARRRRHGDRQRPHRHRRHAPSTPTSPAPSAAPPATAQPDSVIVNGTDGDDAITATGSNGATRVRGLAAR